MKGFFHDYSYSMIKMYVNQLAISIFGVVLAMAATAADNTALTIAAGAFSIAFYLFLLYTMTWEIGAKDRISVDTGRKPYRPHTGLLISLIANIPNLLVALIYSVLYPIMGTYKWAGTINATMNLISALTEGMYRGILSVIKVGDTQILKFWWSYFIIVIPALITVWIAYFAGFKNFRILAGFFNNKPQQGKMK